MVEQQFKANLKWISDNMQGVTLSSQKTKAKHHNAKDCVGIWLLYSGILLQHKLLQINTVYPQDTQIYMYPNVY